eukprot:920517-Pleurochrysis_carterae.AAC.2
MLPSSRRARKGSQTAGKLESSSSSFETPTPDETTVDTIDIYSNATARVSPPPLLVAVAAAPPLFAAGRRAAAMPSRQPRTSGRISRAARRGSGHKSKLNHYPGVKKLYAMVLLLAYIFALTLCATVERKCELADTVPAPRQRQIFI